MPSSAAEQPERPGSVVVFAPSLVLTVTIESAAADASELHLHAGGQGLWVARMAAALGAVVTLCTALGGETGAVLGALLADEHVELASISAAGANGSYVHDRRGGTRRAVVDIAGASLSRHEVDDLYNKALIAALAADVLVLTGPQHRGVIQAGVYRRLASDAAANHVPVVADLVDEPLAAALDGGLTLLKISEGDLHRHGFTADGETGALIAAGAALRDRGATNVVISRASAGALALVEDDWIELIGPTVTPADERGAGDSMTAAAAVGIARGLNVTEAVRLGVAAGALNATRHGLGTGHRAEIEQLAERIEIHPLRSSSGDTPGARSAPAGGS